MGVGGNQLAAPQKTRPNSSNSSNTWTGASFKTITTTTWMIEEETSVGFYRRRADIHLTTEHPTSVWEITTRGGNL